MRHLSLGFVTLGASALLLAGCAPGGVGETPGAEGEPIKLAIVYGLSGPAAGTGEIFIKGFDVAVEEINAAGGVNGRSIEVELLDSRTDPTYAVTALTELLDSGYEPDVIVPGGLSAEVLAMLPLTTDEGLFSVSPASSPQTDDPEAYPNHFGNSVSLVSQLSTLAEGWKGNDVESIGVILGADAFGDGAFAAIQSVADDAGVEIVAVERPDPNALNYDVEFQRVVAAGPDAVYGDFATFDAIGRLLTSRLTVGATDVPFYGGTTGAAMVPADLVDEAALEGECYLPIFNFTVEQDSAPEYLQPLLDAFAGDDRSIYAAGLGWDVVHIVAEAFERAGDDTSTEALTAALLDEPLPADTLALYPNGTSYGEDDHFPELLPGSMTLVPCAAIVENGIRVF